MNLGLDYVDLSSYMSHVSKTIETVSNLPIESSTNRSQDSTTFSVYPAEEIIPILKIVLPQASANWAHMYTMHFHSSELKLTIKAKDSVDLRKRFCFETQDIFNNMIRDLADEGRWKQISKRKEIHEMRLMSPGAKKIHQFFIHIIAIIAKETTSEEIRTAYQPRGDSSFKIAIIGNEVILHGTQDHLNYLFRSIRTFAL